MLLAFVLFAQLQSGAPAAQPPLESHAYSGRANQLRVRPPRLHGDIRVDGQLDEPQWRQAARLTGFSQFAPIDGIPAEDSTEVLVWYSATAVHFGIRALERHGAVNATLAERDRIQGDDHVQLLIGTFNDGRQATVFGVNPLGVQMDGALVESNQNRVSNNFGGPQAARDQADLSPDFVFQSRGRLTSDGYVVEVRIPFKSLRYQAGREQSWALNVVRKVQHSGAEDSWAPARRASASFLAQSGTLEGLAELRRGLVLDVNPIVTARATGAPAPETGRWTYDGARPEAGGNVRWGVTNSVTLNATINPDFAEVESDAGQFAFDPRQLVFLPERRPFFLDGIELFATPNNLVYTRRVAAPLVATKLTGKAAGTNLALLTAVDDRTLSLRFDPLTGRGGTAPLFNIVRIQRDLGAQSRIATTLTDREDGPYYNRVANVDGRLVFRQLYSVSGQLALSVTRQPLAGGDTTLRGPLWQAGVSRNGRQFGFTYNATGNDEHFRTLAGFINRRGVARLTADHRFTRYGARERLMQSFTFNPVVDWTWLHDRFERRKDAIEKKFHFNTNAELRGGWSTGASVLLETFGFDPSHYANRGYRILRGPGDTIPFTGVPRLFNRDYLVTMSTPEFKTFSGRIFYLWGQDENFAEWSSGDVTWLTLNATWRPTDKARAELRVNETTVRRSSDHTLVQRSRIPRVKLEYQLTRAVFVRLVGEHNTFFQDALRDDTRTNHPILLSDRPTYAFTSRTLRGDWLFAYQPMPGTVLFTGYGSSYLGHDSDDPREAGADAGRLQRSADAFFVKLSYLFRL